MTIPLGAWMGDRAGVTESKCSFVPIRLGETSLKGMKSIMTLCTIMSPGERSMRNTEPAATDWVMKSDNSHGARAKYVSSPY